MFFSANLQDMVEDYREMVPEQPTAHSACSLRAVTGIAERTGWRLLTVEGKPP
jgi:hypothetical protein